VRWSISHLSTLWLKVQACKHRAELNIASDIAITYWWVIQGWTRVLFWQAASTPTPARIGHTLFGLRGRHPVIIPTCILGERGGKKVGDILTTLPLTANLPSLTREVEVLVINSLGSSGMALCTLCIRRMVWGTGTRTPSWTQCSLRYCCYLLVSYLRLNKGALGKVCPTY